jgi:hypothetical protein
MDMTQTCSLCGRNSRGITLTEGVCQICKPIKVPQKHVDGIIPPRLVRTVAVTEDRKIEAALEAEEYVARKPSPALKKKKVAKKKAARK